MSAPATRRLFTGPARPQDAAFRMAQQHALLHFRTGSVFSYIPKNACTTLRLSLALDNGLIENPEDLETVIDVNTGPSIAPLRDALTAPFTWTMLRCPYRRLASAFLDKIVDRRPAFWHLAQHRSHDVPVYDFNFRRFARLMLSPQARAADFHWRPQGEMLLYRDYDAWFCVERFGEAARQIEDRLEMPIIDARTMTGHGTDAYDLLEDRDYGVVPIQALSNMKRSGALPSHRALYDDTSREMVRRAYAADIALYRERCGAEGLLFAE